MAKIFSDRSKIFLKNKKAIELLKKLKCITESKECMKCKKSMSLQKKKEAINKKAYFCLNRACRFSCTFLCDSLGKYPRIKLKDYFYIIYKWLEDSYEKNIIRNSCRSKATIQKIKENIYKYINSVFEDEEDKLYGVVQVDETAICKGKLLGCPSQISDDTSGVTWLVGFVETSSTEKRIRLEVVPDRKEETISKLFLKYVSEGTTVITDGHRSYPNAVKTIKGIHHVVNHSSGFKNKDGFHTNDIENVWSQLKYLIKKRKGVLKSNIPIFLKEFIFRYTFLKNKEFLYSNFLKIIIFIFKSN